MQMITYKTAPLMSSALKIGVLLGGANEEDTMDLYETGKNTGIAFQIQDDLIDLFGDEGNFGKKTYWRHLPPKRPSSISKL